MKHINIYENKSFNMKPITSYNRIYYIWIVCLNIAISLQVKDLKNGM